MIDANAKEKIHQADLSNIVRKVKSGKPLSAAELKRIEESSGKTEAAAAAQAAPGSAPAATTISAAQLCALTGLSDRRHRQLASAGYLPPPIAGQYQKESTIAGLFKHFRELLAKKNEKVKEEQEKLTRAKRQTAEEELAILRNEYVKKSEIAPALRNISLHQRAQLLRKYEQELAPKLAGRTALEILELIKQANDDICRIFREGTATWAEAPPITTPI